MAFMLIIVIIWARIAGTEALLERGARMTAALRRGASTGLNGYALLALIYLLVRSR